MNNQPRADELEVRLSDELKHTLKLVPQSQRELFVAELARWYAKDNARERQQAVQAFAGRVKGRVTSDDVQFTSGVKALEGVIDFELSNFKEAKL